jgi:hypothetical protein
MDNHLTMKEARADKGPTEKQLIFGLKLSAALDSSRQGNL